MYGIPLHQRSFTYSRMYIYLGQMYPSPIDHTCMEYHYTKEVSHIAKCTYTKAPSCNWPYIYGIPIHRISFTYSRMHIYLGRCTPSNWHYIYGIPPHHISFTYSRMHIYPGSPPLIDHTCMEYHYTKEFSHIADCTYTKAPLLQLTKDLWNTTTPNKFDL